MLKNLNLRLKLMIIGSLLSIVPLVTITVIDIVENRQLIKVAKDNSNRLSFEELNNKAKMVYDIADTQHELLVQTLESYLKVAQEVASNNGGISTGTRTVYWDTVNQYTKQITPVKLPALLNGDTWFGQTTRMDKNVPIVDKVQSLCNGITSTVFQRMNKSGDMLRVATNVVKKDGTRAIGTYIPQINPDGKPNPVIATVLAGKTYTGRAFVVNAWYITAYTPIYDAKRQIIGTLYVGIPIEATQKLRQDILDIKVCKTGYAYVLNSKGEYLISQDGKRDGENIWDAKDASGNYFIQNLVKKATALKPGEIDSISYPWKNQGETKTRLKNSKLMYFAPWDWVIGVGAYKDEVLAGTRHIEESASQGALILTLVTIIAFAASLFTWFFVSGTIARPIVNASEIVHKIAAERDFTLTVPVESRDEIGRMANELNSLIEQLKTAFRVVDKSAVNVEEHAADVSKRATANRERAGMQQERAKSMQETIKEMGTTAGEVAQFSNAQKESASSSGENVDVLVNSMEEMNQSTQKSTEYGQQVLEAAKEGANAVAETVKGMQNIAESSDQITEIIAVITEIAEKTDLLALNAAIEAARAGEHGKGFAVVADEVGKLAQRSSEAAKEITKHIRDSVARVKEGTRLTDDSRLALEKIMEGGQTNVEAIAEISKAVAAMVSDTHRIGDEMKDVINRSDEMEKLTSLQAGRSKNLVELSESSADVAAKTVEGAGAVVDITGELQHLSRALTEEVKIFKHEA